MDMETSTRVQSTVRQHIGERNTKWVRSIINCRVFNSIKLDWDHRIASANFRIHFRKFKQTPSKGVKYDWNKAIENPEIGQQYQLELKNSFDALSHDDDDPQTMHKNIAEIIAEAVQKVIGNPPKRLSPTETIYK